MLPVSAFMFYFSGIKCHSIYNAGSLCIEDGYFIMQLIVDNLKILEEESNYRKNISTFLQFCITEIVTSVQN